MKKYQVVLLSSYVWCTFFNRKSRIVELLEQSVCEVLSSTQSFRSCFRNDSPICLFDGAKKWVAECVTSSTAPPNTIGPLKYLYRYWVNTSEGTHITFLGQKNV